jgi:hypothetical protein
MALIFFFFVEHFDVYGEKEEQKAEDRVGIRVEDPVTQVRLSAPWYGPASVFSLVFVVAAALTVGFLPASVFSGVIPKAHPVSPVRLTSAMKIQRANVPYAVLRADNPSLRNSGEERESLTAFLIDSDRNDRFVLFDHEGHAERAEEDAQNDNSCAQCHHMNRPFDTATPCSACHRDAYVSSDIFQHSLHVERVGGDASCDQCHTDTSMPRSIDNAVDCDTCHTDWTRSRDSDESFGKKIMAPGYVDAMHTQCIECHQDAFEQDASLGEDFSRCSTCHVEDDLKTLEALSPYNHIRKK